MREMRIRLMFSTAGYARALTMTFMCFVFVGFIRQQRFFIHSIHEHSEPKLPFLVENNRDHKLVSPRFESASHEPRYARTSLHSCRLHNQTLFFPEIPSFIIIGAQKAGSSALADNLKRHPSIVGSNSQHFKELHFLDWFIPKKEKRDEKQEEMKVSEDELWCYYRQKYARNFDVELLTQNSSLLAFDKSPSYLFHGYYLPEVLKKVCPWNPKLLAILRDPIDRAWSHFNMAVQTDRTKKLWNATFEQVLDLELESLRKLKLSDAPSLSDDTWDATRFLIPNNSQADIDAAHKKHFRQIFQGNYLQRGMYAVQLRKWKEAYGANLLVVRYEHLYGPNRQNVYNTILDHIGVARVPLPVVEEKHWSRQSYRRTLSNRTRDYLRLFFEPYNRLLPRFLPKDVSADILWHR